MYPPSGSGLTQIQPALECAGARSTASRSRAARNTISGAIAGVDVTLVAANADDETTQVTVGYDRTAARKTIDELVKSYNDVVDAIKSVSSYDPETKQGGPLFGDAGVRNIVFQLRRELTSNVSRSHGTVRHARRASASAPT